MSIDQVTNNDKHSGPAVSTIAGTGVAGFSGDQGPAPSAQMNHPYGVAVDGTGAVYVAEYSSHRVRKITADGQISTVAGTGVPSYGGDDGPATAAELNYPRGVAVDGTGAVYIADSGNHRIRKIEAGGTIRTVAGTGTAGFSGDGGSATAADLDCPYGVAVDSADALYIADHRNHRVRKVTPDGKVSTVAGKGAAGFAGDGGPGASAELSGPHGVAVDDQDVVYIADAGNHRVRKLARDGQISTVAGTGTAGFDGDDGPAASAELNGPVAVVTDRGRAVYIADQYNHRVRKITADGQISTVAGTGTAGFDGDDGPAASAELNSPVGIAVDRVGALYIADHVNNRVRKIASEVKNAGLPESGTVASWANVRSRLRMGVARESLKGGAEVHQLLAAPRDHQRWQLIAAGQADGDILYRIENVRSGKVLEVTGARKDSGAPVTQAAYEGDDAHHQQWRLIPVDPANDDPAVYEIANRNSGLLLRVDTNARTTVTQDGSEGDHRNRRWQLLPV